MSSDLSFTTVKEMIDELARRFDAVVLLTTKTADGAANERTEEFCATYRGGWNDCFGLVSRAKVRWDRHELADSERVDDEEGPSEETQS